MASIYTCKECGPNLHLSTLHLYRLDFCFEAENEDSLSFSSVDASKFRLEKEDKIRPFFKTLNRWAIQWRRTKIIRNPCGRVIDNVYNNGLPMTDSLRQFHMGPSQAIPMASRYRFKNKALLR